MLVFLLDLTQEDPAQSYRMLRAELLRHDAALLERPSVLALTKSDTLAPGEEVRSALRELHDRTVVISSVARTGLERLVDTINELLT